MSATAPLVMPQTSQERSRLEPRLATQRGPPSFLEADLANIPLRAEHGGSGGSAFRGRCPSNEPIAAVIAPVGQSTSAISENRMRPLPKVDGIHGRPRAAHVLSVREAPEHDKGSHHEDVVRSVKYAVPQIFERSPSTLIDGDPNTRSGCHRFSPRRSTNR